MSLHIYDLFHPLFSEGMHSIDRLEALEASREDANGRMPHEPGYVDPRTPDLLEHLKRP